MQTEQAHAKGLFEGLQGLKILSVANALHTPGRNRCRGISSLLRWPEWPTKAGRRLSRNFIKSGQTFSVLRFARTCCSLVQCKNSQPFFSPPPSPAKFHTPFWNLIWGDFVHCSALVCLLCVTFFSGNSVHGCRNGAQFCC